MLLRNIAHRIQNTLCQVGGKNTRGNKNAAYSDRRVRGGKGETEKNEETRGRRKRKGMEERRKAKRGIKRLKD